MAPRANWKGYLRLSLVSCPIALYPLSEKVSFGTALGQQERHTSMKLHSIFAAKWMAGKSLKDPALPLNPGEEALDEPASHVPA
jgi:non-homologous end joining protein Ku